MIVRIAMLAALCLLLADDLLADTQSTAPLSSGGQREHQWLQNFVGEWDSEVASYSDCDSPTTHTCRQSVRSVGDLWIVMESVCEITTVSFTSISSLGYDPDQKQYVGYTINSSDPHLWYSKGTLDASGKSLTLWMEGPLPGGGTQRLRDTMEFRDPDTWVVTSAHKEGDEWKPLLVATSKRRK